MSQRHETDEREIQSLEVRQQKDKCGFGTNVTEVMKGDGSNLAQTTRRNVFDILQRCVRRRRKHNQ